MGGWGKRFWSNSADWFFLFMLTGREQRDLWNSTLRGIKWGDTSFFFLIKSPQLCSPEVFYIPIFSTAMVWVPNARKIRSLLIADENHSNQTPTTPPIQNHNHQAATRHTPNTTNNTSSAPTATNNIHFLSDTSNTRSSPAFYLEPQCYMADSTSLPRPGFVVLAR